MRARFASSRLKLDRAIEHLEALRVECAGYLNEEPKPYFVAVKFEADEGCHVARIFIREGHEPPDRIGLIAGDLFNNLRSALDHLVWDLACSEHPEAEISKPGVRKRIYFPVCANPEEVD